MDMDLHENIPDKEKRREIIEKVISELAKKS